MDKSKDAGWLSLNYLFKNINNPCWNLMLHFSQVETIMQNTLRGKKSISTTISFYPHNSIQDLTHVIELSPEWRHAAWQASKCVPLSIVKIHCFSQFQILWQACAKKKTPKNAQIHIMTISTLQQFAATMYQMPSGKIVCYTTAIAWCLYKKEFECKPRDRFVYMRAGIHVMAEQTNHRWWSRYSQQHIVRRTKI